MLPWPREVLDGWCEAAMAADAGPCPPWRVATLCRRIADGDSPGRWVYGAAKLMQEAIVRAAVPERRPSVLRLANTFGIGQERVIVRLIRRALAGRELRVTESVRSFLAVEDVARVVLAAPGPRIFNVGGGPVRLTELAGAIREYCDSDAPHPRRRCDGMLDSARGQRRDVDRHTLGRGMLGQVGGRLLPSQPRLYLDHILTYGFGRVRHESLVSHADMQRRRDEILDLIRS